MNPNVRPVEDSLTFGGGRLQQSIAPTLVAIGYQLEVLIRVASSKIERQFATFADLPYHDRLSRQRWEQLWRGDWSTYAHGAPNNWR
jgi:hypothetical protein